MHGLLAMAMPCLAFKAWQDVSHAVSCIPLLLNRWASDSHPGYRWLLLPHLFSAVCGLPCRTSVLFLLVCAHTVCAPLTCCPTCANFACTPSIVKINVRPLLAELLTCFGQKQAGQQLLRVVFVLPALLPRKPLCPLSALTLQKVVHKTQYIARQQTDNTHTVLAG